MWFQPKSADATSDLRHLNQQRKTKPWMTQHKAESSHMKKSGTTLHSLKHGTLPWRNMRHTTVQTKPGKTNHFINPPCPFFSLSLFFILLSNIHHSWYNIPPKNPLKKSEHVDHPQPDEAGSQPIDFASFVPTHDASLSAALDMAEQQVPGLAHTSQLPISQDKAFERAVQTSYWSGYWTAIYHVGLVLFLVQTR